MSEIDRRHLAGLMETELETFAERTPRSRELFEAGRH